MRATFLAMPLVVMLSAQRAAAWVEVRTSVAPRYGVINYNSAATASVAALDRRAAPAIALEDHQAERAPLPRLVERVGGSAPE
jgi:hypothetical protein